MENHIYQFKGVKRIQGVGGPTGLDITGELADLIMLWWDLQFMEILRDLGLEVDLYGRFKDDGNIIIDEIPEGTSYSKEFRELVYQSAWSKPRNSNDKFYIRHS